MAVEESTNNSPQALDSPSLPQYPEMILAAIEALNDKDGSNMSEISKHIEETHGELPASHSTQLSHHLNVMTQSGELVMFRDNYMKPDPNAPPRRGRGRPPKPKVPIPPGTVVAPPRPRGRPPKVSEPLAPPKKKEPSSGRPRGRPRKKAKTAAEAPPRGAPRGRGRPPKVQPPVAVPISAE